MIFSELTCVQCEAFCPEGKVSKQGECRRHPPEHNKGYPPVSVWTPACYEIVNEEFNSEKIS